MRTAILIFILVFSAGVLYSCGGGKTDSTNPKINIDLEPFTADGIRKLPSGEQGGYIHYEFCIPADETTLREVQAIDSTAADFRKSKGRAGCSDKEWLVIGSSRQADFKGVLKRLAKLSYIRKINETFWE